MEDLSPLRLNPNITNLDLRLNPVARTEADYRLFVVNILPNLKILGKRCIEMSLVLCSCISYVYLCTCNRSSMCVIYSYVARSKTCYNLESLIFMNTIFTL